MLLLNKIHQSKLSTKWVNFCSISLIPAVYLAKTHIAENLPLSLKGNPITFKVTYPLWSENHSYENLIACDYFGPTLFLNKQLLMQLLVPVCCKYEHDAWWVYYNIIMMFMAYDLQTCNEMELYNRESKADIFCNAEILPGKIQC